MDLHSKMSKILGRNTNDDFVTQLKMRFLYYLTIAIFFTMLVIIVFTIYSQYTNPNRTGIQWPVILTLISFLILFAFIFMLLVKGFYKFFSHAFLLFSFGAVWTIMFFNNGEILTQLDTVVYILGILTTMPLLVFGKRNYILAYALANLLVLWAFTYLYSKTNAIPEFILREYTIEITIVLVFMGLVVYNNSKINKIALNKAYSDIQARIEAEKELETSEKKFREMIELLPYAVLVTDMDGKHIEVNEAYCKEIGYSKEEIIGKTPQELNYFIDEETLQYTAEQLNTNGLVENIETTVTKKDQTINYVYFSSKLIHINDQPLVLSSTINITEKKKMELELDHYRSNLEILVKERTDELDTANEELTAINEELHSANEELHLKNEIINEKNEKLHNALEDLKNAQFKIIQNEKMASLGVLTAGVAHEINNPLNFIMGGYYGLENHFTDAKLIDNKDIKTLLNSIKTGVERSLAIVNSLNQFSRSKDSFHEICDIHSIIDNCLVMLNNRIKHGIEIKKEYLANPTTVPGNVGKLHQVFINILHNACQAITNEGTITIKTTRLATKMTIEISDTGCGISEKNLSHIIEPFFTTKEPGQGTGLGLYITYTVVQEHKGKFKVKSKENEGTMVTISLPIQ